MGSVRHCMGSFIPRRWMAENPLRAKVPIDLLKQLRAETGASIQTIKLSLHEAGNDMERTRKILKSKQNAQYLKRVGNTSSDGAVMIKLDGDLATMVKLSCETDFVARTQKFRETIKVITEKVSERQNSHEEWQINLQPDIVDASASLGEAIHLKETVRIHTDGKPISISKYVHNTSEKDIGRIGVLIALESNAVTDQTKREKYEKQTAINIQTTTDSTLNLTF